MHTQAIACTMFSIRFEVGAAQWIKTKTLLSNLKHIFFSACARGFIVVFYLSLSLFLPLSLYLYFFSLSFFFQFEFLLGCKTLSICIGNLICLQYVFFFCLPHSMRNMKFISKLNLRNESRFEPIIEPINATNFDIIKKVNERKCKKSNNMLLNLFSK